MTDGTLRHDPVSCHCSWYDCFVAVVAVVANCLSFADCNDSNTAAVAVEAPAVVEAFEGLVSASSHYERPVAALASFGFHSTAAADYCSGQQVFDLNSRDP